MIAITESGFRVSKLGENGFKFSRFGAEFSMVLALQFPEVHQFPLDGRIILEVTEVETIPIGLALFEADEEGFVGRGH